MRCRWRPSEPSVLVRSSKRTDVFSERGFTCLHEDWNYCAGCSTCFKELEPLFVTRRFCKPGYSFLETVSQAVIRVVNTWRTDGHCGVARGVDSVRALCLN